MGTNESISHTPERVFHINLMRLIARDFHDLPMVLKGGTALLLCYGLDRFSEDLDFDAPKKFNVQNRIQRILALHTKAYSVKTVKDTATVQRLKAHYTGRGSDRLLKVETSFRGVDEEGLITVIDGIRTYKISALIEQKIKAFAQRTAARDLYDIAFLSKKYPDEFSSTSLIELQDAMVDESAVEQRFQGAFIEDEILDIEDLPAIVLQISGFVKLMRQQ